MSIRLIVLGHSPNLIKLVETAFILSRPVVIGQLDYYPGALLPGEAQAAINATAMLGIAVSISILKGRRLQLTVYKTSRGYYIPEEWPDHSQADVASLLSALNISEPKVEEYLGT